MTTLNFSNLTQDHQNTIALLEMRSMGDVEYWKMCIKHPNINRTWYSDITNTLVNEYQTILDMICEDFSLEKQTITPRTISCMSLKDVFTPITYNWVVEKFFNKEGNKNEK